MKNEMTINVGYVANLARLRLSPEEASRLDGELRQVVAYFTKLREVDVSNVAETACAPRPDSAFRADEPEPSLDREAVLRQAPERLGDAFKAPRIVE